MTSKNLVILVLVAFLALFFMGFTNEGQHQEPFEKVLPLSSQGTFSLQNVNGSVTLTTWKEAKVEIKALKKTKKDAENLQKVKIEVSATADSVSVDTVYPKHENTGVSVDYDVRVPEGVNLGQVSSVNGDVTISGPLSRVSAASTNGDVSVDGAAGEVRLETTNGGLKAANLNAPVTARTTNGAIVLELAKIAGEIDAETTNGSITLRLASTDDVNALLEAETTNGSITFDFPVTLQSLENSRHRLRGRIGSGGPQISLQTVNGSIHLTR
jgi:DUF4097 and DUF4098 domain-containing protein YvlB